MEINTHQYEQWSEAQLNERIFALYDQIQKVTLQNLEVAQKNCQLQIQIKTIDDIIQSSPVSAFTQANVSEYSQTSMESKYQNLIQDHHILSKRVNQIEDLLYQNNKNKNYGAKSLKHSSFRNSSSIPSLMLQTHRKSISKKDFKVLGPQNTLRRQESTKNYRFK